MSGKVLPLFAVRPVVRPRLAPAAEPEGFAEFWRIYPRKVARQHAALMWARLTRAERAAALAALPAHVAAWQARGTDPQHIPHAGTWLNPRTGRRWEDELEPQANDPASLAERIERNAARRAR